MTALLLLAFATASAQSRSAARMEEPVERGKDVGVVRDDSPVGQGLAATGSLPRFVKFTGTALAAQESSALITLSIYSQETGGSALWSESQTASVSASKQFTLLMGAANAQGLPAEIFSSGEARWLGIRVNGGEEQARVLLVSVPYAMKAGDSDSLGGRPASAYVLADSLANYMRANSAAALRTSSQASREIEPDSPEYPGNPTFAVSTTGGTSGYVPVFSTDNVVLDSILFQNGSWLGIGGTSPNAGHLFGEPPASHNDVSNVKFELDGRIFARGLEIDDFVDDSADPEASGTGVHVHNHVDDGNALEVNAWGNYYSFGLFSSSRGNNGTATFGISFAPIAGMEPQVLGVDSSFGMQGRNSNQYGAGVLGYTAFGGINGDVILETNVGLMGVAQNAAGIAGVLEHTAGGQILSARNNGAEVLAIDGNGDLTTTGIITGNGSGLTNVAAANLAAGTYTGAYTFSNASNSFTGSGSGLTNVNAAQLNGSADTAFAKLASANAFTNSNTFTGIVDASGSTKTLPVRTYTGTLPTGTGICTANKELIIRTDGSAGNQLYICNTTADGWTAINTDPPPAQDPLDTAYTNTKFGQVRLLASAFSPGTLASRTLAVFTPEQNITIRRISAVFMAAGATCDTDPVVTVTNGTNTVTLTLTTGTASFDAAVTATNMAANTQVTISTTAGTGGTCSQPQDGNILVEYRMQ